MLKKAIITIKGDIQEAGYRAKIMKIAQKLNLEGVVENLPTGEVVITCEGKEETIKKLVKEINIKTQTIEVESIEKKYEKYKGEFKGKGFTVKVKDANYEMFQGYATAGKYFEIMFDKQDKMLGKQDETLNAINKVVDKQEETNQEIKEVKVEVIDRYGEFSKDMKEIKNELRELREIRKDFRKLVDYFIDKERDGKNVKG